MSFLYGNNATVAVSEIAGRERGEFAQEIYADFRRMKRMNVKRAALTALLLNAERNMEKLNRTDAFPDITYDNPLNNAAYYAVSCGFLAPLEDGRFGAQECVSAEEVENVCRLLNGSTEEISAAVLLKHIWEKQSSMLAEAAAVHCWKQASLALSSGEFSAKEAEELRKTLNELKEAGRPRGIVKTSAGSAKVPDTWIYHRGRGPLIREYHIQGNGKEKTEIVFFSDLHFNLVNEKDRKEANPSVLSTEQYRLWMRGGESKKLVEASLRYARFADQTVIGGDILDFLSWGCAQLSVEFFRRDADMLACPGGHDVTRVMQGKVPDPTPLESRKDILRSFWINDLDYASRILRGSVMLAVLNNGSGDSNPAMTEKLAVDLELARREKLVVILFAHEPFSTCNPAERELSPIRWNYTDAGNFENVGSDGTDGITRYADLHKLIRSSADVVKAVVCGHYHSDFYTEILGWYRDAEGKQIPAKIPQIISTAVVYDEGLGHLIRLIVG